MNASIDKPFSMTIHGIERDLESNPRGRGGTIRHDPATPGRGGSGCHGDYLLKEWRELEAALAAERDRADRAEARIAMALLEGTAEGSVKADVMHVLRPYGELRGPNEATA